MRLFEKCVLIFTLSALFVSCSYAVRIPFATAITEADMQKFLPVLQVEATELSMLSLNSQIGTSEPLDLAGGISAGTADALQTIRTNSKFAEIPDGAKYVESASKQATNACGIPTAVFTFGISADELQKVFTEDSTKLLEYAYKGVPEKFAEYSKIKTAVNTVYQFYAKRNFATLTGYRNPFMWFYTAPDGFTEANLYEFAMLLDYKDEALSSGPVLELKLDLSYQPGQPNAELTNPFVKIDQALVNANVSNADYDMFKLELMQAREDAGDPTAFQDIEIKTSEYDEEKQVYDDLQRILLLRKANAEIYRRYADTLNPLLDAINSFIGD